MVTGWTDLFSGGGLDHFSTDGYARNVDVMMRPALNLIRAFVLLVLVAKTAFADGGAIRLQTDTGAFHVTVFTQPPILAAGPVDITVLIQNRKDLAPIMDAAVTFDLIPLEPNGEKSWMPPCCSVSASPALSGIPARLNHGENRLLYGAVVQIPHSGNWKLKIDLRRASEASAVETVMNVAPPLPPPLAYWHLFALPGVCAGAFAIHRIALRARRKRKLSFAPLAL
jgi:hypothetical protein